MATFPNALTRSKMASTGQGIYYGPVPKGANESLYRYTGKTQQGPLTGGNVLGDTTGGGGYQAPSGSGGGGEGAPMESTPEQPQIDFDALINPVLEQLGQSESAAQSIFGETKGNIESTRATNVNRLNQTKATQGKLLDQGETQQKMEGESAADQVRRQFAEIQQGLQAKFGGTTGTGAFATELAGRDTIGAIANIRQGVSSALQEINNKRVQIEELSRIALEDIENNAQEQVTQARQQLEGTLSSIRAQRGELQARKAKLALNAMQDYQSLVADINARNTAFKQNLYMQKQAAEQKLTEAQTRARSIAESFSVRNMQQGRQVTPVLVGNRGTIKDFQGNQVNNPGPLYGIGGSLPDLESEEDENVDLGTFGQ